MTEQWEPEVVTEAGGSGVELAAMSPDQPEGPAGQAAARSREVLGEVVRLLAGAVDRLRTPLLAVALLPVVPALVLLITSIGRGGGDVPFAVVLAVIGVIPAAWLLIRRRQLTSALQPPTAAVRELAATFEPTEIWAQVRTNLESMRSQGPVKVGGLTRVWRGVRTGNQLWERVSEMPRIRPFLPGRLRGIGLLVISCVISAGVLSVLAVVKLFTALIGVG